LTVEKQVFMKNQAQRKEVIRESYAGAPPRARATRPGHAGRDPLAYRVVEAEPSGSRPVRPAATGVTRPRRKNRRRVPPITMWNGRFRALARALGLALVVEIVALCLTSPLLTLQTVKVAGAHVRTPAQIARAAGLDKRSNIFRAPMGRAEAKLAGLPEVASVHVERQLPRTAVITLQERSPLAYVNTHGHWWAMDKDGLIFRQLESPPPGRPRMMAAASSPPVLGKKLKMPAMDAALKCLARLSALPLPPAVAFHVDARHEAWLNSSDGFKIKLGPLDDAPARLAVTERLLKGPDGPQILQKALVLDMATPDNEVYKRREDSAAYRLVSSKE
jgi:cell division septal protein FtsQ